MAGDKWLSDLTATTPLRKAARRVLKARLDGVRAYLPLAVEQAERDAEHVHQLRVATRRARAALDIFACCLPRKSYKTASKRLRRIRRAAGTARDWDVFLADLAAWKPGGPRQRPGLDHLLGYAQAQRERAEAELEDLAPVSRDFHRSIGDTISSVRKPRRSGLKKLRDLAQPLIGELLGELNARLAQNENGYNRLHELRILGKRLRYAMEVFVSCYAPAFREQLYPAVETMQEILGQLNDHRVAAEQLEALASQPRAALSAVWKRLQPGFEARLEFHRERLAEIRGSFQTWTGEWREISKVRGTAACGLAFGGER